MFYLMIASKENVKDWHQQLYQTVRSTSQ